ncbi:hypothetical protein Tsubulata_048910 [Turnera subulata]|uniref:Uncharacterized protein n=1 Tax=Turnera subulata TaxID=218843 RepID=A0A9Q0FR53_9ROSI|nr:hypothetical protein Tsubulata_048910 [Turnera subulata]
MATHNRGSDLPLSPLPSKKGKVGVQSEAAASAHFFHFDIGKIRAAYVKEGRGLMYSEKLKFLPGMGRLVSGGRAYTIGGDGFEGSYPRKVWICDLNRGSPEGDAVHLDGDDYDDAQVASMGPTYCCPWIPGPVLGGAKPRPLVFAFQGKIYALSGGGGGGGGDDCRECHEQGGACGDDYSECHKHGPVFEFLEEEAREWQPLPKPRGMYDPPLPIIITSHLVLDNRLWVSVHHPDGPHQDRKLCFDLIKHEWVYCFDTIPYPAKALCNLWPTRPHGVGRDIHYHAEHFYAVTQLCSDSGDMFVGLGGCSATHLWQLLTEVEAELYRDMAIDEEDRLDLSATFQRLRGETDPVEKALLRSLLQKIRDRLTAGSLWRYYRTSFHPFPKDVGLVEGLEDCKGFTEAIFYPPEEDVSHCRLLAHYQEYQEKLPITRDFGARWGTLVLWTFRLNSLVATDLRRHELRYPHQAAGFGGTPSILTKPDPGGPVMLLGILRLAIISTPMHPGKFSNGCPAYLLPEPQTCNSVVTCACSLDAFASSFGWERLNSVLFCVKLLVGACRLIIYHIRGVTASWQSLV